MNKFKYKIIIILLIISLSFLLIACGNKIKIEIYATSARALAGERIAIIPKIKNSDPYQITWYEKDQENGWVEKESYGEVLYLLDNVGGKYEYKAKITSSDKTVESNIVAIEFVDITGKTFGHGSPKFLASTNIDFSIDDGSEQGKIIHQPANRIRNEYAYFKGINHTRYVISADVDIVGVNGSDPFPKSGLLAAQLNDKLLYFAFDARPTFDFGDVVIVECNPSDGGTWKWPGIVNNISGLSFRDETGNRVKHNMTVVRDVEKFYFLLNGNFITEITLSGLTQPTLAGTYTMAQHTEYSNYYAYPDDPVSDNDQYDIILKSVLNQIGG